MNNKKLGFTLIEITVIIAVLAILGTIAFLSFRDYWAWARDTKRVADLVNIKKQLSVYESEVWQLPKPENYVKIMSWSDTIWYQWYVWSLLQKNLELWWKVIDPRTKEYYSYNLNLERDQFALAVFLESVSQKVSQEYNVSLDENKKMPLVVWNPIWVLLNKNTSETVQKDWLDIDVEIATDYVVEVQPWVRISFDKIKYLPQIYKAGLRESCADYLKWSDSFKDDNTMFLLYKDWVFSEINCDMPNL